MEWVLFVYLFSATTPFTDDVPIAATVPGFRSEAACLERGEHAKSIASRERTLHYVCKARKAVF